MFKIVAKLVVREDLIPEFQAMAKELVAKSAAEEGNVSYSINQSVTNPCVHAFIEIWKDQDAIQSHNASEHFQTLLPKLAAMATEPAAIEVFTEV